MALRQINRKLDRRGVKSLLVYTGLVVFLLFLLLGCALDARHLRARLNECEDYDFDALVYRRTSDGAVTRVLCLPRQDEMDIVHEVPPVIPKLIRLIPGLKRGQ